jgi:hypothetical protein
MASNQTDNVEKKNDGQRDVSTPSEPKKGSEKRKNNADDDTRNSGFRSSRIRDAESRTSETGDPSVS